MKTVKFQYYNGRINDCKPAGWVSLHRFVEAIRNPKPHVVTIINKVAEFEAMGNMKAKAREKEKLHRFTPCVHIRDWRNYENIVRFTGLIVLDFDHIIHAPELKNFLFDEYECIIAAWLSPSRRGVKALLKIPIVKTVEEFKEYFYGISAELYNYEGYDTTPQNAVLDLFCSIDSKILYRTDATEWQQKGIYTRSFEQKEALLPTPIHPSYKYEKIIIQIINSGFDRIKDNGHPQLRSLCLAVGGYVANNYIDYSTALQQIDYRIANHHYLKKGIAGYKKTARQMLDYGMAKPLHLKAGT